MSEQKTLTDIEKEAANSYREWPVYIVMRLKRLQAIQERLRVHGDTPSAMIRREELLKAVYDQDAQPEGVAEAAVADDSMVEAEESPADDYVVVDEEAAPAPKPKKAKASGATPKAAAKASTNDDSDYAGDVNYDD